MGKTLLIPVKYARKSYPEEITPRIQEVAGHFDVSSIRPVMPYSLHTEYCYGPRRFDSSIVRQFPTICAAQKNGIPQLWFSKQWSFEFADFIVSLVGDNEPPRIIEIHPPFDDYCPSIEDFAETYSIFEKRITEKFPGVIICIEHRFGTTYRGGKFLISGVGDILKLAILTERQNLNLMIVLDFVQLFSRHFGARPKRPQDIDQVFTLLKGCIDRISSIHIWGKKRIRGRLVAHQGDLNDYFEGDAALKKHFLTGARELLADDQPRFFIPEVNSTNEDLISIVREFQKASFEFV
jgi:hypothetical protein